MCNSPIMAFLCSMTDAMQSFTFAVLHSQPISQIISLPFLLFSSKLSHLSLLSFAHICKIPTSTATIN